MPMHAERDIVIANPSVRLSVTRWYCIETNAHIVKLFPPSGGDIFEACRRYKIPRGTLSQRGVEYTRWEIFLWYFDRNRRLSRKRYEIGPWFLWITNRKSQVADRSVSVPMTLNDLERRDAKGQFFSAGSPFSYAWFDLEWLNLAL